MGLFHFFITLAKTRNFPKLLLMIPDDSVDFVNALKNGSEDAFTNLFNLYNVGLCSYAYRILNDDDEAREVVHSTFCKIWDNRKQLDINESLKSYLYKSVYNNSISLLRKKNQYKKYVDQGLGDLYFNRIVQNPHAELKLIDSETRKIISSAIDELPERCRAIFIKCKIHGLSYKDVAEEMDISIKTVEAQMSIALKRLRKRLDWLLVLLSITGI